MSNWVLLTLVLSCNCRCCWSNLSNLLCWSNTWNISPSSGNCSNDSKFSSRDRIARFRKLMIVEMISLAFFQHDHLVMTKSITLTWKLTIFFRRLNEPGGSLDAANLVTIHRRVKSSRDYHNFRHIRNQRTDTRTNIKNIILHNWHTQECR